MRERGVGDRGEGGVKREEAGKEKVERRQGEGEEERREGVRDVVEKWGKGEKRATGEEASGSEKEKIVSKGDKTLK